MPPADLHAMQARFDDAADLAELRAMADQRDLARRLRPVEPVAMQLLIGFCASLALVCLGSQILHVVIP